MLKPILKRIHLAARHARVQIALPATSLSGIRFTWQLQPLSRRRQFIRLRTVGS